MVFDKSQFPLSITAIFDSFKSNCRCHRQRYLRISYFQLSLFMTAVLRIILASFQINLIIFFSKKIFMSKTLHHLVLDFVYINSYFLATQILHAWDVHGAVKELLSSSD